jgi:hypothetical protein
MHSARRLVLAALYVAPWAWIVCFAVFVAAVTVKVGHFPSYSNPDPKHVEGLGALYELTVLLLFTMLLSPVIVGGYLGSALIFGRDVNIGLATTALYATGLGLAAIVLLGDAFGLANWLFD